MSVHKHCFLAIVMMAICLCMKAQMPDDRFYHQLPDFPFVLISDDYVHVPPEISDSLFDAASRGIRFKVNSTELQPTDPFITIYKNKLVPWLKQQDLQLRQVFVRGAASPEGPYDNNVRLSRGRTKRLIEFLSTELGQPVDENFPIEAASITEDYGLLVRMMRRLKDPDYERVRDLWEECEHDERCCKQKLMALDNGKVWKRLLDLYFPSLRQARVVLWFSCKQAMKVNPVEVDFQTVPLMPSHPRIKMTLPAVRRPDAPQEEEPVRYERRHLIAARTNLLHDLLYVPQFGFAYGGNIQLEYYPLTGHYTYNAGFTFTNHRHWNDNKFFQLRDLQLELRRYFKGGGDFTGAYLGLYAEGTKYGIGFSKTKGWEGEGGGAGLSGGYTCRLNRKGSLRLELSASVGMFITRYDPYVYGNPLTGEEDGLYYYDYLGNTSKFRERNHQFLWLGPTNAGIHVTYDIIYRKKHPVKGGQQQKGGQQ